MKRHVTITIILAASVMLLSCGKKQEISQARYQTIIDTLGTDLDYDTWMDFAYELSQNYPQEYNSGMVFVQATERAIMEQDRNRFNMLFDLLKTYPDSGSLELVDQIAVGNRFAYLMAEQFLLFNEAPAVMEYTLDKFHENEHGLQWRDELGGMIYDTQGAVLTRQQDTTKALEAYSKSLEYMEVPETLLRRGVLLESIGSLEEALEDYIAALRQASGRAEISNKVKAVYAELNPDADANAFMRDLHESVLESRKEQVVAEAFFADAPDFEFRDFSGRTINNSSAMGKVVFVDFWATWCGPCRRELPEFQAFYNAHKNDPRIIFVAASTDQERDKVQPYIDANKYTFPVAYAEDNATKFGVEGIPSLFIIGPEGKIRYKIVGYDPDKEFVLEMNWRLESLLNG